jgi:CRISPR-associated endonuclease/helicase Cas3
MYFAHSISERPKDEWQRLEDHLHQVGTMAERFATAFSAGPAAKLAGLLHDLGKYTVAFQARLEGGAKVDHATAGARQVLELASAAEDKLMAELVAYVIAGHHSGLPDKIGGGGSLADRLRNSLEPLEPEWREEITPDATALRPGLQLKKPSAAFQLGFLGRMIFSCLIDADRRDTEAFCAQAEGWKPDRDWPALGEILDSFLGKFNAYMSDKQTQAEATPVNRLRREILEHVRARAHDGPGLFTLNVPTGGGKTLASLAFALDHAKAHGLERIVYAIPFTSVVDQTADVFRNVLGGEFILEHHSAIDEESVRDRDRTADKLKLAMEDWAAPVVVTTNVQLFESLFAARPSRCRKLHNLARSVIVLDEAQTIPLGLLRPCVAALDELARNYGATIVLCTATQPALDARHFTPGGLALEGRELAPDPARLARELKRVRINFGGEMNDDALVDALAGQTQGLIIVNSRAHALALFRKVKGAGLEGVIHLTTRQYAAHRRTILADVRARLTSGLPCRLIATSLVEAGVDLDFPRLWRAEAGLDQIAQAAGRCNREGGRSVDESIVTVFKAAEHKPPREIARFSEAFARMRDKHPDLLSPEAIERYFREVYWQRGDDELDREKILESFKVSGGETSFAYRTVADNFRMIESGMVPVIIARDEAAKVALTKLAFNGVSPGGVARDLQSYLVQVPPKARAKLIAAGHVTFEREKEFGDQFVVLRAGDLYRAEEGLLWEDADYLDMEKLTI